MAGHRTLRVPLQKLLCAAGLLCACLVVALLPTAARAKPCGQDEFVPAQKRVTQKGPPPLAVGDSVMLLALNNLAAIGYDADGQGCRHLSDVFPVLRRLRSHGKMGHLVVLALGTDGRVTESQIKRVLHLIGPTRVLGLVTPRELGGAAGFDASVVRFTAHRYPKRIVLLDWVKYSAGHGNWFQPDRTHLAYAGAAAFTRLLRKALHFAPAGRFPNGTVFPH